MEPAAHAVTITTTMASARQPHRSAIGGRRLGQSSLLTARIQPDATRVGPSRPSPPMAERRDVRSMHAAWMKRKVSSGMSAEDDAGRSAAGPCRSRRGEWHPIWAPIFSGRKRNGWREATIASHQPICVSPPRAPSRAPSSRASDRSVRAARQDPAEPPSLRRCPCRPSAPRQSPRRAV